MNSNDKESNDFINQITLNCLLNPELYEKYIDKNNNCIMNNNIKNRDRKFYRKRIFDLTKKLLLSDVERTNVFPEVTNAFDNYINNCIYYFKANDTNDILQKEYIEFDKQIEEDLSLNNLDNQSNLTNDKIFMENTNKLIFNYKNDIGKCNNTMDMFVKKEASETKSSSSYNTNILKKKKINLRNPELRYKGININNSENNSKINK